MGGFLVFLRAFVHFIGVRRFFGGRDGFSDDFFDGICPLDDCFNCALFGFNWKQTGSRFQEP
jgi:hypothetical protein